MEMQERIEQCIELSLRGDNERALSDIEGIIGACSGADPDDLAYALMTKGSILARLGRHGESLASYRNAALYGHNNPSLLYNLGLEEITVGHRQRGKEYLQRAAQLGHRKATSALATLDSGTPIAFTLGESEDAAQIIRAHIERGMRRIAEGGFLDAVIEYGRAIALAPELAHTYTLLGVAYEKLGEYQKALDHHSRAIDLDPSDATAHYNRGVSHGLMGNWAAALHDYSRSLELDPSDPDARYNRGQLYNRSGKYQEAVADFTRALESNPSYAAAYNDRALAYGSLGREDAALRDLLHAVELDPDQSVYRLNLAACYLNSGKTREGVVHLVKAVQQGDPRAQDLLRELGGGELLDSLLQKS